MKKYDVLQRKVSFYQGQYNVHRQSERPWEIYFSKRHLYNSMQYLIGEKCGFVAAGLFNLSLPISLLVSKVKNIAVLSRKVIRLLKKGFG